MKLKLFTKLAASLLVGPLLVGPEIVYMEKKIVNMVKYYVTIMVSYKSMLLPVIIGVDIYMQTVKINYS